MKNSQYIESKIKLNRMISRIIYIVITISVLNFIIHYGIIELFSFFDKSIIICIGSLIILPILVISIYCIVSLNNIINLKKISIEEKEKIYYELDNEIEIIFEKYGLYVTKNYIICVGNKINFLKAFIIPIKEIDAVDTYSDDRYFYKPKGQESKNKVTSFIKGTILDILFLSDNGNNNYVFNIICNKKVYTITRFSSLNKIKLKEVNEMADYICDKYKDIDYI